MDNTLEMIKSRRSIRRYKPDMVPQEMIDRVIEAGLWAASGMGRQSTVIIAVTDRDTRDALSRANAAVMGANTDPFYGAPAVLIVLGDRRIGTCVYDGSLAIGNMLLEAHAQGLGACWIHRAKEEFEGEIGKKLLRKLGIEGDYEGIGHVILGYPDGEAPAPAPRKDGRVYHIK